MLGIAHLAPLGAATAVGMALGAGGALFIDALRRRRQCLRDASVYELKGQYYQELGHAWDHETKDFKVIYRPLYHCEASDGRFEAHVLASSHFERWEKFRRVTPAEVPDGAQRLLLPGPFTYDPDWRMSRKVSPLPRGVRSTRSGLANCRSHELPRLCDIIGDCERFIDEVDSELRSRGVNALASGFEMDHLCYRCATISEYLDVVGALVPALGTLLVEGMIGGRPIATVGLHRPLEHRGFVIRCIEVPCACCLGPSILPVSAPIRCSRVHALQRPSRVHCSARAATLRWSECSRAASLRTMCARAGPKPGRAYAAGLEHAELVVGEASDGCISNARLLAFVDQCATGTSLTLETSALHKGCNADVSHAFTLSNGRPACIKFHNRPLYEVVEWEKEQGAVVPVPKGYFAQAKGSKDA